MVRTEEIRLPDWRRARRHIRVDGHWRDHPDAIIVRPGEVRRLAILSCVLIPPQYFVATAEHESGFCTNEIDTEPTTKQSFGLYQVDDGEAADVGEPSADLLDPVICTRVFARLQERRLARLIDEFGRREPDIYAYLGLAHNEGLGAAQKTLRRYGMDWAEYKRRNATNAALMRSKAITHDQDDAAEKETERVRRISAYGDAMISGGTRWNEAIATMQ